MGVGGVVFASGLAGAPRSSRRADCGRAAPAADSATRGRLLLPPALRHALGLQGSAEPEADVTLEHAVATINAVDAQPDFVVFTGDLTHTTDDAAERRTRMARFKEIVSDAQGEGRPLPARRARRLARPRRRLPGGLRRDALRLRPQGRPLRRARQRVARPAARSATRSSTGSPATSRACPRGRPSSCSRTGRSSISTRSGTGRPRTAPRRSRSCSQRDDVTVFYGHIHQEHHQHDREHRAPLGPIAHLPAARARLGAQEGARWPGTPRAPITGSGGARSRCRGPRRASRRCPSGDDPRGSPGGGGARGAGGLRESDHVPLRGCRSRAGPHPSSAAPSSPAAGHPMASSSPAAGRLMASSSPAAGRPMATGAPALPASCGHPIPTTSDGSPPPDARDVLSHPREALLRMPHGRRRRRGRARLLSHRRAAGRSHQDCRRGLDVRHASPRAARRRRGRRAASLGRFRKSD